MTLWPLYRKKKTRLLSHDIMAAFGSVYIGRKKTRPLTHDIMAAFGSVYIGRKNEAVKS